MPLHASWIHGTAVTLERPHSPSAGSKSAIRESFAPSHAGHEWFDGDIVDLGGYAAVACLRMGWGARFVVFDHGDENNPKSGDFYCHYPIPTPVIEAGSRARARTVLIDYCSTDIHQLAPLAIGVWDGNRHIFRKPDGPDDDLDVSGDAFDGGIPEPTDFREARPDLRRLWRGDLGAREVFFGLVVSILIHAHQARDAYLEIRGVGIDFDIG